MLSVMAPPVAVLDQPPTPTSPTFHIPSKFPDNRMDRFAATVEQRFTNALTPEMLHIMSTALLDEYHDACESSTIGMLPSFCHTLPKGSENGAFLALDVGGSTLRVALIKLNGRRSVGEATTILKSRHHFIDQTTRSLVGRAFFSWMADRIYETLEDDARWLHASEPLRIGLAWSFPIEYVYLGSMAPQSNSVNTVQAMVYSRWTAHANG